MFKYLDSKPYWQCHFWPLTITEALRDVPNLSIGAAYMYIWSAAWARNRGAFRVELRNLRGLVPANHRVAAEIDKALAN